MPYTPDLLCELNALVRFNLDTSQVGIKVHKNAEAEIITAMQRLHAKNLITQIAGGDLTPLGREAALHAQATLGFLTSGVAASV